MHYDIIILGGGPAGLSAGLYAARAKMRTLIIERKIAGGQIALTDEISNYPGTEMDLSGAELARRMREQAENFGCAFVSENVVSVDLEGECKRVTTDEKEYEASAVILAMGAHPRKLGIENEEKFSGRGISFCATCDAPFFEGLDTYVVGGGDSAVEEAIFISKFAKRVTIIHRRDELRAAKSIQERAFENPKIEFMWDSVVTGLSGDKRLTSFTVKNVKTGEEKTIGEGAFFGLFVMIGLVPETELVEDALKLENGYIVTDENMSCGIPGVYAAGDVRKKEVRQVVTATSDGAIAAVLAARYLDEKK